MSPGNEATTVIEPNIMFSPLNKVPLVGICIDSKVILLTMVYGRLLHSAQWVWPQIIER